MHGDIYDDNYGEKGDRHGYYAMLMFDGDDMGMWYSKPDEKYRVKREETEVFQSFLSHNVSEFAEDKANEAVNWKVNRSGSVIYAGGEDFLGALNIRDIFNVLYELREAFGRIKLQPYTDSRLTFSAGIVIAHVDMPLTEVLRLAREAEQKAKNSRTKKDSFCLTIAKRGGETTEFTQPFYNDEACERSSLKTLEKLIEIILKEKISTGFIYQLSLELERLSGLKSLTESNTVIHREIFLVEAKRILEHAEFENDDKRNSIVGELTGILHNLAQSGTFKLSNLLMYLRAIAFIARERGAAV
jgi:CRISPR-associated protein Cmr2